VADLRIRIGNHEGQTALGEVAAHRQTGLAGANYEDVNPIRSGGAVSCHGANLAMPDHAFP
jgi:hypothetical protein